MPLPGSPLGAPSDALASLGWHLMNYAPTESIAMKPASDPLERFVQAQQHDYAQALAELSDGRKRSHWIWYVLPQLRDLGRSEMARRYGIADRHEAAAYLAHPVLGPDSSRASVPFWATRIAALSRFSARSTP